MSEHVQPEVNLKMESASLAPISGNDSLVLVSLGNKIAVVPPCAKCRKPIIDFDSANFETSLEDVGPVLGKLSTGEEVGLIAPVRAYHWECTPPQRGFWFRVSQILRKDQRGEPELSLARDAERRNSPAGRAAHRKLKREFVRLCRVEPALRELEAEIRQIKDDERAAGFCANRVWYHGLGDDPRSGFRNRMAKLAGWFARVPSLQTTQAYDVAYHHLYDLLPPCRNCTCFGA